MYSQFMMHGQKTSSKMMFPAAVRLWDRFSL